MAKEVIRVAMLNDIRPGQVVGFQFFPGRGLGGLVQLPGESRARAVLAGSRSFVTESGLQIPELLDSVAQSWEKEDNAIIAFGGWEGYIRGVIKFARSPNQTEKSL